MTKKIRKTDNGDDAPQIYHTRECESYPDEVRDVTEADERRGVRQCHNCKRIEVTEVLEEMEP